MKPPPLAVRFVEDMDLWKFNYKETRSFVAGLSLLIDSPSDPMWFDMFLNDFSNSVDKIFLFGDAILKSQARRVKYLFDAGLDINFHGHSSRVVNSTSDTSVLGEYIYSKPEYDLAIIWHVKNHRLVVSLRSNIIDCSTIAKKYGGGGHPGASGFSIQLDELRQYNLDTILS